MGLYICWESKVFLLQRTVNTSCASNYTCLFRESVIFLYLEDQSSRKYNKITTMTTKIKIVTTTKPTRVECIQYKD